MQDITIPLWLLSPAVGLPLLCVLLLGIRIVRAKRAKDWFQRDLNFNAAADAGPVTAGFADNIHHQVPEQQVDGVFDTLVTLIGTERVKLKSLLNHSLSWDSAQPPMPGTDLWGAECSQWPLGDSGRSHEPPPAPCSRAAES